MRVLRRSLLTLAAAVGLMAATPGAASATEQVLTFTEQISVEGYEVRQDQVLADRPSIEGHVTHMEVDIVDASGDQVPISRLMLHHIVFLNIGQTDQTCNGFVGWENGAPSGFAPERFMAAGEERGKMDMPPGYGYDLGPQSTNQWAMLYMVMNHKATDDSAFIQYEVTVDDSPLIQDAVPYWLDSNNCRADPIYNVPGTGPRDSKNVRSRDFPVTYPGLGASGGRIIAGGGHVHGGAYKLRVTQPACDDRTLAQSLPTWGELDHPFYNVRPILHEPGPIHMTAFKSEEGFPVQAGEPLRLDSVYDDSQPHTRVMGIMIIYIARDPTIPEYNPSAPLCGELPDDVVTPTPPDGRADPVDFEVPLTGLDDDGNAIEISKPPGKTKRMKSGATLEVGDNFFKQRNVKVKKGAKLEWSFASDNLHNVTLANGPEAIGSPNLDRVGGEPRTFSRRFERAGTYRLFCGLHPVQMTERVVVEK